MISVINEKNIYMKLYLGNFRGVGIKRVLKSLKNKSMLQKGLLPYGNTDTDV